MVSFLGDVFRFFWTAKATLRERLRSSRPPVPFSSVMAFAACVSRDSGSIPDLLAALEPKALPASAILADGHARPHDGDDSAAPPDAMLNRASRGPAELAEAAPARLPKAAKALGPVAPTASGTEAKSELVEHRADERMIAAR